MKFENMSVKTFLEESNKGNVNYDDFYNQFFKKLKEADKKYNLLITTNENKPKIQSGKLKGLPLSIKDCICTKDIQTTSGSKILEGYTPPFDATAIKKLKHQGGIIIGKTAQDEFGHGTFSTNCAYKIPKNPLDETRTCGGSSGGAGGITAALNMPHIAIAESTGGSISAPAAFTGTVGITPTYGRISRYGLIDYANSLDKIGAIGKTVEDVAFALEIIAGHDPLDETSANNTVPNYQKALDKNIKGMKIGIPEEYFKETTDEKIKNIIWDNIKKLESLGATYEKCTLKTTKYVIPAYYIIAMCETSTNLAKFCGMRYGASEQTNATDFNEYFSKIRGTYLGEETKRRIILGTYARMAGYRDQYYLKAMKVRTMIINDYKKSFKKFDCLVSPTMPFIAPKFKDIEKLTPLEHYSADILTVGPNLAGIPMISVPVKNLNKMPVGMHILADHMQEEKIITLANSIKS
ncbi:Asp-tRNA(Asn)/Glu-tRNA(Gln) amidotransferase subunit GatA [archaeon]|nr:Asp-tRNA(Asn)/Glu-tRNA(Gln) amidotransferase subunit GatA [archaeon]